MKIPIAETFHSLQGEGQWVGTPMFFIRLAGCSVGKLGVGIHHNGEIRTEQPEQEELQSHPFLKSGKKAWLCQTWDGRPFWCDTDFHKYEEIETLDLFSNIIEDHICLTGGEPLIHTAAVNQIFEIAKLRKKRVHVETSGTIRRWWHPQEWVERFRPWVSVSPKLNADPWMVKRADELKVLVGPGIHSLPQVIEEHPNVYLQPINHETAIDDATLALVLEWLKTRPGFKLSLQLHKVLGLR